MGAAAGPPRDDEASAPIAGPLGPDDLEARLRAIGATRYHDRHPFNERMHAGTLTPAEIRTWVANRYYYQTRIPRKDAVILAKSGDPEFRRAWVQRLHDHDGRAPGEGGLELWLRLAEAVGLDRAEVASLRGVLPDVRRACDAYVELVESADLLGAVAASLTELFAGDIMRTRIAAFEKHYPWVDVSGLEYFRSRTRQAPRDAAWGLAYVRAHARTREEQERCLAALGRKCEILWSLLDAVEAAQRRPRLSPHAVVRDDAERPGARVAVLPERAVRVNDSGCEILDACDGARTAEEIARDLAARHPEEPDVAADVHDFLAQMERLGVLVGR
jgi:pyrroloquinoline-quinone synthase